MARNDRNFVNLDALIPRADLFGEVPPVILNNRSIRISDLAPCAFYDQFRKPDFQRETSNWAPQQVASLIKTFADQDIIPSLIFWQNGPQIFVIDGAHRLSALIAWVRDDYGAGKLSQDLFKGGIPAHQTVMDKETRALVKGQVGTWADFSAKAPIVGMKDLNVQWIENNTALQAGEAFIRINQGGTEIDPLEVRIVRAPRAALSVATRAITHGGTGHEYWRHFKSQYAKAEAPTLGSEIYELLFRPTLKTPIKTTDLPLAGLEYSMGVIRLAFDLVALANDLKIPDSTRRNPPRDTLPADELGDETVRYLKRTRREIRRILSDDPSSFGLHPGLYFYSSAGVFQPAALLNMIAWIKELDKRNALSEFRKARGRFEELLLCHPVIVKPATHTLGTGGRTRRKMLGLFNDLLDALAKNKEIDAVWQALGEKYPRLVVDEHEESEEATKGKPGAPFTGKTKSAVTLDGLMLVGKCALCGGLLHPNGKVLDHLTAKAKGGKSAKANARYVHPVCNSEREKDDKAAAKSAG